MKCRTIERWLLERTDEPPRDGHSSRRTARGESARAARRARRIEAHLEACASCRKWREEYEALGVLVRRELPAGEPSATVLANIRREARRHADRAPTATVLTPWLRPAYGLAAAAALCIVLAGSWYLRPDPVAFGGGEQLKTILLMLSEETNTFARVAAVMPAGTDDGTQARDALARELLTLQGLDADYTESELRAAAEAPQATAPLTRNIRAVPSERYG